MGLIPRPRWARYRTVLSSLACKQRGRKFKRRRLRFCIKGRFRQRVPAGFSPVTLLDNPPAEAAYVIRENFGPLRAVIKYRDLDEAVRLAPYGLEASVWGTDPEAPDTVARRLDAGMAWIN
jgi:acyl-CoA reductase-like NAD-dependent aldehyde dehydrogenase